MCKSDAKVSTIKEDEMASKSYETKQNFKFGVVFLTPRTTSELISKRSIAISLRIVVGLQLLLYYTWARDPLQ